MDNCHFASLHLQTARRLQSKQAASNHYGLQPWPAALEQGARVVEVTEYKDAFLLHLFNRRNQREAAGRQQELIEGSNTSVVARNGLGSRIDADNANAKSQIDFVLLVPIETVQDDVVTGLFAGQHRGQQDAVIVHMRLIAKDRDLKLGRVPQNLFHTCDSGHSISYHHEFFHRLTSRNRSRLPLVTAVSQAACSFEHVVLRLTELIRRTACSSARAKSDRRHSASPGLHCSPRNGRA